MNGPREKIDSVHLTLGRNILIQHGPLIMVREARHTTKFHDLLKAHGGRILLPSAVDEKQHRLTFSHFIKVEEK